MKNDKVGRTADFKPQLQTSVISLPTEPSIMSGPVDPEKKAADVPEKVSRRRNIICWSTIIALVVILITVLGKVPLHNPTYVTH